MPVEIVHGLAAAGDAFASSSRADSSRRARVRSRGVPHHRPRRPDRFAREVIGLEQSDWMETDLGGIPLTVRFYHCNPRHHSLALGSLPIELLQKLHHVMLETVSQDNVGLPSIVPSRRACRSPSALGKHDNDKMFSFYVVTPAGFQLEFGHGADDRRAVDREPSLRPDQRVGPPAAPVAAPREGESPDGVRSRHSRQQRAGTAGHVRP